MIEVKKWDNNPRMMWVWDSNISEKIRLFVFYIRDFDFDYNVFAMNNNGNYNIYKHCAEIEEEETRRMTYKELSRWLRGRPDREWKPNEDVGTIYSNLDYIEDNSNEPVYCVVREGDEDWRIPTVDLLNEKREVE